MASRLQDVILRGTRANQPAIADVAPGTLYYVTDEGVTERAADDNSAWEDYSDSGAAVSISVSAGTASNALGNIVFSNSNGVTFGLSGSTITGSVVAGLSNINVSAGTTSNNLTNMVFSNSNGVSFGLSGSTITGSVAAAGLSNINISAGTTSNNLSAFVFSNSNGVSFGLSGSTVTGSIATSLTNVNISAGTTSNNLSAFVFSNSNGVSFGLSGSTVTASVAAAPLGSINFSAGTTSQNLTNIVFSNSNNASFGLNGSTITVSAPINISGGTTSNNLTNLIFSNSNGVSFGLDGSTVTASVAAGGGGATLSFWNNMPSVNAANALAQASHVGIVIPMPLEQNYSFDFFRIMMSISNSQYTIANTSVNTTWTGSLAYSLGLTAFTHGTGASSHSIMSFKSTQAGWTYRTIIGAGAVGSNYSVSIQVSYPREGGSSSSSYSYACTSASYVFNTSGLSLFGNTLKYVDVPFGTSFSPGNYWLGMAYTATSTNSGGPSGLVIGDAISYAVASQLNNVFSEMGVTNLPAYYQYGAGRLNNTTMFLGGFNTSDLSSNASAVQPIVQGIRRA